MNKRIQTILLLSVLGVACTDSGVEMGGPGAGPGTFPPPSGGVCLVEGESLRSGFVVRDGIPALTNPQMVSSGDPLASYVLDGDRVIGLNYGGEWIALPLNVMRWHEIVNLDWGDDRVAVTYCPLTGSGLAFDRGVIGGAEFGVSGLLWRANLVMYDRSREVSFWPQMRSRADCGPLAGTVLPQLPVSDMTWRAWKELHPGTRVVSEETGWRRDYRANPYEDYERVDAPPLSDVRPDLRRQPKERVLGIPHAEGGIAIPFGVLPRESKAVLTLSLPGGVIAPDGTPVVVFWDGAKETAEAFYTTPDWSIDLGAAGSDVVFGVEDGRIVDSATGSYWEVDGRAVEGPASGSKLREVRGSMIAYWFAWAAFNPETDLLLQTN